MKKIILLAILLSITLSLSSQQQQYEVTVINVSVPVRVFEGNNFVDNLMIEDFELYEDGKLQKIEALYLTKKTQIERREESRNFMPLVSRRFYLLFEQSEHNPKLAEAMDYFFSNVFLQGDTLEVMTPVKNYTLPPQALESNSKESIAKELNSLIRKDTLIGSAQYMTLIKELKSLARRISSLVGATPGISTEVGADFGGGPLGTYLLPRYRENLEQLEQLRVKDEKKFFRFAAQLKRLEGQKNVFFFYQREFRPDLHPRVVNRIMSDYQDQPNILATLQDLMLSYSRTSKMNVDLLKKAFADSSILFNFIYMHQEQQKTSGIQMTEQSEDVFSTFTQIAEATGGITDTSQNPAAAFKAASEIAESYYLLYYSPEDYRKDGKYRNIEVKVKNKECKITHRQGYFAR